MDLSFDSMLYLIQITHLPSKEKLPKPGVILNLSSEPNPRQNSSTTQNNSTILDFLQPQRKQQGKNRKLVNFEGPRKHPCYYQGRLHNDQHKSCQPQV